MTDNTKHASDCASLGYRGLHYSWIDLTCDCRTETAKSAHAPGPWTEEIISGNRVIIDSDGLSICKVFPRLNSKEIHNVALIISAPETAAERDTLKAENEALRTALHSIEMIADATEAPGPQMQKIARDAWAGEDV